MKRELPFLSPISIIIAVLVFAALGIYLLMNGGMGFSPGPVSAQTRPGVTLQEFRSHADFEKDCQQCHQPLSSNQTDLCSSCHSNIADQRASKSGMHGRIDPTIRCADCHPEHKGRSFDPVAFAVSRFDHNLTRLPLTGAHTALDCERCHTNADYQLTYQGCGGCHSEPRAHKGMYAISCEECHTDLTWKPAVITGQPFDHSQISFTLTRHTGLRADQEVLCSDCHTSADGKVDLQSCISCHAEIGAAFIANHQQTMGPNCLQCHDGNDRMSGFDHQTIFSLDGQHSQLECVTCHQDFIFKGNSSECSACHQDPEIHVGFFGSQCQYCHTSQAWTPAKLIQHTFILDHGGQGDVSCQTCHPNSYAETTCYACHDHTPEETASQHQDLNLSTDELLQCARCHPTGQSGEAKKIEAEGGEK